MCQYVLLLFINKRIPVKNKLQHIFTVIWITFKQIDLTINAKNVMTVGFILHRLNDKKIKQNQLKRDQKIATFVWISLYILFFKVVILFCFE